MNDVLISLITEQIEMDEYGNENEVQIKRKIFAKLDSISQQEFLRAGQLDLRPEYRFTVWKFEYSNEKLLEYDGKLYSVYRTFAKGDFIELYITKRLRGKDNE